MAGLARARRYQAIANGFGHEPITEDMARISLNTAQEVRTVAWSILQIPTDA